LNKEERDMTKNRPIMTVSKFLLICVMYKLLSIDEAITALRTNRLPGDILERIRKAEVKSMN
jgi:hypothetical protein